MFVQDEEIVKHVTRLFFFSDSLYNKEVEALKYSLGNQGNRVNINLINLLKKRVMTYPRHLILEMTV